MRSEDGIALLEFALVLPILVTLYLGTVEITQAVIANRKVVATASSPGRSGSAPSVTRCQRSTGSAATGRTAR